jgi:hypothetical protein
MSSPLSTSPSATAPSSSSSSSSSTPATPAPAPFRGPAADSRLGELLLDVLPLACFIGHALDLHHARYIRYICGLTLREGVRRADGSLDRAGFLGGAADMIKSAARIQAPWLAEARAKGREGDFSTQLMSAAREGNEQRVRELVAAGAPLDLVGSNGCSALSYASMQGHARIAKLLLDGKYEGKGADINLQDNVGWTPLMIACFCGHEAVARLLLERGANATLRHENGSTALSWARFTKRAAIMTLLEAHGAPK